MNKFTLVVEKDENEPTPQQTITAAWSEVKHKNIYDTFEFYHRMREEGFDHEVIIDTLGSLNALPAGWYEETAPLDTTILPDEVQVQAKNITPQIPEPVQPKPAAQPKISRD